VDRSASEGCLGWWVPVQPVFTLSGQPSLVLKSTTNAGCSPGGGGGRGGSGGGGGGPGYTPNHMSSRRASAPGAVMAPPARLM
jgi:hypothetical protein